jgi:hypothetical protein
MKISATLMFGLGLSSGTTPRNVSALSNDPKAPNYGPCSCGCNRLVNNASRVVADYPRSPTVFWCATDICVVRVRAGMPQ